MLFALISSLLWAIINIFDRFTVREVFTRPSQGLAIAGISASAGLIIIPFTGWHIWDPWMILLAFGAGLLMQASQWFYFSAIEKEEVGDIAMIASAHPMIVAILAIPVLHRYLTPLQWLGICVVTLSILGLKLKKGAGGRLRFSLRVETYHIVGFLGCISIHSIFAAIVLEKYAFWEAWGPYSVGMAIGGFAPFTSRNERLALAEAWPRIKMFLIPFVSIETINILAIACQIYAMSKGHPAIANTLASTEPAFCFLIANRLSKMSYFPPDCFPAVENMGVKLFLVVLLALGIGMITA